MNIYQKLQHCRVELQEMNLRKSGENKFAKYSYFELADFLPAINKLFLDHKLFSQVSFDGELATLTIINIEKPEEQAVFTSPMAEAQLKGCHEIQNLGAVETYQRRYLYMTALEIVEHDALDATTGEGANGKGQGKKPPAKPVESKKPPAKPAENKKELDKGKVQRLAILRKQKGISEEKHKAFLANAGVETSKHLTEAQYKKYAEWLEKQPDAVREEAAV